MSINRKALVAQARELGITFTTKDGHPATVEGRDISGKGCWRKFQAYVEGRAQAAAEPVAAPVDSTPTTPAAEPVKRSQPEVVTVEKQVLLARMRKLTSAKLSEGILDQPKAVCRLLARNGVRAGLRRSNGRSFLVIRRNNKQYVTYL